jgi:hypothetical protein
MIRMFELMARLHFQLFMLIMRLALWGVSEINRLIANRQRRPLQSDIRHRIIRHPMWKKFWGV